MVEAQSHGEDLVPQAGPVASLGLVVRPLGWPWWGLGLMENARLAHGGGGPGAVVAAGLVGRPGWWAWLLLLGALLSGSGGLGGDAELGE
jgi:hypothetical protein